MIAVIGEWERTHDLGDSSWNYYECWLTALERVIVDKALVRAEDIAAAAAQPEADSAATERQGAP